MGTPTVLPRSRRRAAPAPAPSLARWTLYCAAAETVGMTAASGAARAGQALADRPGPWGGNGAALAVVVAGGLVEGVALGTAQALPLGDWLRSLRRGRYVLATVLVAGLGWAAGAAPGVLAGDDGGAEPPLALMLLGAVGLGLAMGPALGAAQASALRGAVPHPWRWVGANTLAWPAAMALIFLGASRPDDGWPLGWVLVDGAVTGAMAGSALGLVTGWFLPSLTGAPPHNRAVLGLLASPWRGRLDRRVVGLAVRGRVTGRSFRFPVQYAVDEHGLVVVPGHFERKTWWRNLRHPGTPVEVLWSGDWVPGVADLLRPGDPARDAALATYRRRWPRVRLPEDQVVVRIRYANRESLGR